MSGKLIVLEGLDGCGKSTQFELLLKYFENSGQAVSGISFPDYDSDSSTLIKMYLEGKFGDSATEVNPYAVSSFYSADRFASYKTCWESKYKSGELILVSRYTTSNLIYQMSKLDKAKWNSYIDWLYSFEYRYLELPSPDMVIYLDMPIEISQKLMTERYGGDESKKDVHEKNLKFLHSCSEAALYAADKLGWIKVSCVEDGKVRSIEDINKQLREIIQSVL